MDKINDEKTLIKLAKKQEKKNPEFLYELGLRFKNGDGIRESAKNALGYFNKAADLGHVKAQIEVAINWWKKYNSYYYANLYFQKAIAQGSEEAKELFLEMQHTLADKDNPEFLYKEGMRLLSEPITTKNLEKATKFLYNASKLNFDDAKLEYGRHFSKRYYTSKAEFWLKELVDKKYKDADQVLEDLLKIKKVNVDGEPELYETPKFKDDGYTSFIKKHTFTCCPICRARLNLIKETMSGDTTEKYIWIYNPGTSFESKSDVLSRPTSEGLTVSRTFECDYCKLSFTQNVNTRLVERDADPNLKDVLGSFVGYESFRLKWAKLGKVTYDCHTPNVTKDTLKILNKFSGSYDEDKI